MITVPEAARRAARDPETIRRWIRAGRLAARKVGTQHVIDEHDLIAVLETNLLPVPEHWRVFDSGNAQPDWTAAMARSRRGR